MDSTPEPSEDGREAEPGGSELYIIHTADDSGAVLEPDGDEGFDRVQFIFYTGGTCPDCRGRGSILLLTSTVACTRCNGSGMIGEGNAIARRNEDGWISLGIGGEGSPDRGRRR